MNASSSTHESNGRFAQGNPGGPGNPLNRQIALLRAALLDATTPEMMKNVFQKVYELALEGDLAAIKVFLQYTVGKPGARRRWPRSRWASAANGSHYGT